MIYYGYYLCPIRSTTSPLYSPRGILNSSHIALLGPEPSHFEVKVQLLQMAQFGIFQGWWQHLKTCLRHGDMDLCPQKRQACSAPVEMDRSWYRNTTCGSLATSYSIIQYPNQCSVNPVKALPLNKTVVELMHGSETVFSSQSKTSWESTTINGLDCFNTKKAKKPWCVLSILGLFL